MALMAFAPLVAACLSAAAAASEATFTGEALIQADNRAVVMPWSISKSGDGGFYVTGSVGNNGWAVKVDAKGHVIWRYELQEEEDGMRPHGAFVNAAVPAPDGGTYLCAKYRAGASRLVRLDGDGHEVNRIGFTPNAESRGDGTYDELDAACLPWGDGFVYVGDEIFYQRYGAPPVNDGSDRFYWVVVFGRDGHVKKQWQIPAAVRWSARIVAYLDGSNLVLSKTDNTNTDIVRLDLSEGSISKQKIPGSAFVIAPLRTFSFFSFLRSTESQVLLFQQGILFLSKDLRDQTKAVAPPPDFLALKAYSQGDGAYMLLGRRMHGYAPKPGKQLVFTSKTSHAWRIVDLPLSAPPVYSDTDYVVDMTGGYKRNQFVVIRRLARAFNPTDPSHPPVLDTVVLDFVEIN